MDNPLSREQIDSLKEAKRNLAQLEKRIADAKRAGVSLPSDIEVTHKQLKDRVEQLLLVYGNK